MRLECRERFPRHRPQRKPLVSNPSMYHSTCVTHMPWCMLGSLTCSGGENVPGIPSACAAHNFMYLARGPWSITPVAQIPQCTSTISHNVLFCNRNVHMCAHFCYKSALWDIHLIYCGICEMGLMCFEISMNKHHSIFTHTDKQQVLMHGHQEWMSRTVCVTFTWDMYIYMSCL